MSEKEKVIKFYEKNAYCYEEKRFATSRGRYEDGIQKEIAFGLSSWQNLEILEVGCGTGRFSIEALKWVKNIVALDPSLSMLKKLKEKINTNMDRIELVQGSGYELPFKDNSFDGCICINVLNHLPQVHKVFVEIHRILKPKAFFIFNFPNLQSLLLPVGLLINWRKNSLKNPVYTKWYTLKEIKSNLQSTGFRIEMIKGVFLPPIGIIPFPVVRKLNKLSRDSALKYISANVFIKAIADKREV